MSAVAIVGLAVATLVTDERPAARRHGRARPWCSGVIFVLPIGGADVPVLISLLNSFTGLAVAASGFTLNNNLLIIAGTLVGASGILLTRMMSKAMGRSLAQHPVQRLRVGRDRHRRRRRHRARPVRCKRALPRTSACCWPTPARW